MGPGSGGGGGSEGGEEFVVEEGEPGLYNPSGVDPPVWQPTPQDILLMFEQLERDQVLPLKWSCPGRRPPETDLPEQPLNDTSDGEEGDGGKEEEKRVPEPSAFDFDDTASEASAKVKLTPRTPAQAKRPGKKVACMDNIISSLKRQQKAEREARKSQARSLGMTGFRGGTPSRMSGFSPATSPHVSAATSPVPASPRGSPRVLAAVVNSPSSSSSRAVDGGGESGEKKQGVAGSPSTVGASGSTPPLTVQSQGSKTPSPPSKAPMSEATVTEAETAGVVGSVPSTSITTTSTPAGDATTTTTTSAVTVKMETDREEGEGSAANPNAPAPMETEEEHSGSVSVKKEG